MALTQLKTGAIADDAVTTDKLANAINTERTANTAKVSLGADSVTGAKIADDAIDSEHYTDGSIDTAHIADSQVTTAKIAADAVTAAKIADDAVGSEHIEQLDADLSFADSAKANFGAGDDLSIFHDGNNSNINDGGTGYLAIRSNNIRFENAAANEALLYITENGSVDLYYDNSKKFETTSDGVNVQSSGSNHGITVKHSNGNVVAKMQNKGSGDEGYFQLNDAGEVASIKMDGEHGRITATSIRLHTDNAANELDDYEEGTWSPKLRTIGSSQGEVVGAGTYTKIGNTVTINVQFDNKDPSGIQDGNYIQVSNLPFTANSIPCTSTVPQMYNVSWTGDRVQSFVTAANTSTLEGYESRSGGSWFSWQSGTFRSSGVYLRFNLTYFT